MSKNAKPSFLKDLFQLMIPVILQGLIMNSLNFIDVLMIGQLGEAAVSAVGVGNQVMLLQTFIVMGIGSGAGVYTAQLWGRRFIKTIKKTLSLGLQLSYWFSLLFTGITFFFPLWTISLFSPDPVVQSIGTDYLQIASLSYFFTASTAVYAVVLRSVKNVRVPLIASCIALTLNTVLNYCLIFGHWGFPSWGVQGAAIATLIARVVEFGVLYGISYLYKFPTHMHISEFVPFDRELFKEYVKLTAPMVLRSALWFGGVLYYQRIFAHVGTAEFAAYNVVGTIERLGNIFAIACGMACSILVGNNIGKGDIALAKDYSKKILFLAPTITLLIGLVLIFIKDPIIKLYDFSPESTAYAHTIFYVVFGLMWLKTINIILNMGIFRAGGDTRFSMYVDVGGIWLIGVPLAYYAAFVLNLSIEYVILITFSEEIVKAIVGVYRFMSNKWINNLTDVGVKSK